MNFKFIQKFKVSKPFERIDLLNLITGFLNNRYIYLDILDNRNLFLGKIILKYNEEHLNLNNKIFELLQ